MVFLRTSRSKPSELIAAADLARDSLDWSKAAKLYQAALDLNRGNPPIWVQLGHALKESGNLEAATRAYAQAVELDPLSSDPHLQLGHARKLAGDIDGATDAYRRALEIDPGNKYAKFELKNLGEGVEGARHVDLTRGVATRLAKTSDTTVALDVSDLMHYFLSARSPTGIQRVQINVVASLIESDRDTFAVLLVCFTKQRDFWIEIDAGIFKKICRLALIGADLKDRVWQKAIHDLHSELDVGEAIAFPRGTALINLGTSWWLQNYFLMIRHAKARYDITYIPFVHDCIPVITPEHCISHLTQDFIEWLLGVFSHADGYLVNSNATKNDLIRVADFLGHHIAEPKIVHLDGRFPGPFLDDSATATEAAWPEIQRKHNLGKLPIVLFVSTIESRKNHQLAFNVWLKLIKQRGLADVPMLVCVGRNGWLNEAALAKLQASELLRKRVLLLSDISDAELAALYSHCLFTIYPSSYEGWGLPVTESLCYGKLPLISNTSSLPEAGGPFAEYFEIDSERDFQAKLERLIDDVSYRSEREEKIKTSFNPRDWNAIAEEIAGAGARLSEASGTSADPAKERAIWPLPAAMGVFHQFSRNSEAIVWRGMSSGELYRMGLGWNECDDWGCWMKSRTADIAFRAPENNAVNGGYLVALFLQGLPLGSPAVTFAVHDVQNEVDVMSDTLQPGRYSNYLVSLPENAVRDGVIHLRISSSGKVSLSNSSEGHDTRIATLGVCGFFYCREGDIMSRLRLIEAMQFSRGISSLRPRPIDEDIGIPMKG